MNIERNSYQNPNPKCKGCKLFFGSEAFNGYCSSCYKKQFNQQKQQIEKEEYVDIKVHQPQPIKQQNIIKQTHKGNNLCNYCHRNVRLLGISCKCGFIFCNKHKMPQDHSCIYNYYQQGIKYLQKNLIKVTKQKISSIN